MTTASEATAPKHLWLVGSRRADRTQLLSDIAINSPCVPTISAHRSHRGAYTAAGTLIRQLAPTLLAGHPELVAGHEIEILSVAPELESMFVSTLHTLTSLAVPAERTRFYSSARTLRIAHGLVELLRDCLTAENVVRQSVVFEDMHGADYTDQEFVAVLLRRMDPAILTVIVASEADLTKHAPDERGSTYRPIAGGLPRAVANHCRQLIAPECAAEQTPPVDAAAEYVRSDCTDDRPDYRLAYLALTPTQRQLLHDAQADALSARQEVSLEFGAIPLHRRLGSDPLHSGTTAMLAALDYSMRMGYYDITLELGELGRTLCPADESFDLWWRFTTKLPTTLGGIGLNDRADLICNDARARTDDPLIHLQLAYATAILHTRHWESERRDHDRALGWINIAIALSSQVADPAMRAFTVVFNKNGRALIQAHRGRPQDALDLVTKGIESLDSELRPDEQLLHRSVLRYNRAQVLAGMGRIEEALADYRQVIEVDPNYPEYHFELGNLLHRIGRDEESLAAYAQAARLGPPFIEVEYNRADLLLDMGRLDEALTSFNYVLELDPDNVDARLNRGGLLADLGSAHEAQLDAELGLEIEPGNAQLLNLKARLAIEAGVLDEADAALNRAIAINPALVESWILRGTLHFTEGDLNATLADLSQALELDESDLTARFNRGRVLFELGRWQQAAEEYDRVLDADPAEPDALLERARCSELLAEPAALGS